MLLLVALSISNMYLLIDITNDLAYYATCLKPLAMVAGCSVSTMRRKIEVKTLDNKAISDAKYIKGRYLIYQATKVNSQRGKNSDITVFNKNK